MRASIGALFWGCNLALLLGACGGNAQGSSGSESGGAGQGGSAIAGEGPAVKGGTSGGGATPGNGGQIGSAGTPGYGGATDFGGAPGYGGATGYGGAASGGAFGSGGQNGGCCLAIAICDDGDTPIPNGTCPAGATCYERSVCCSTIHCAHITAQCNAFPSCDAGDKQVTGECPPDAKCYSRTLCGNTINCLDSACDPATEYNKKYVAKSCASIDYGCSANTWPFSDSCGCGCEQDANCPEYVDCQPGPQSKQLSPLCADKTECPFTLRAL